MNGDASPQTSSRGLSDQQVSITENVAQEIYDRLNLRKFGSSEEASQEASIFEKFLKDSKTFTKEKQLQKSLLLCLKAFI